MHDNPSPSIEQPSVQAAEAHEGPNKPSTPTNRLAKETSPYLLLHKHNPVDWYPWGKEAFDKAAAENKPIFLSIGYSSCYWCHVMERESFSDPKIAKMLNEHFVCIKVDREELPDVDEVYMTAIHSMGLRGGWPLSVFLTPDRKPFFGGTYWPPEDRAGMVGFRTVVDRVTKAWRDRREEIDGFSDKVADALRAATTPGKADNIESLQRTIVSQAVDGLTGQFDPDYGGFGYHPSQPHLPKFPQSPRPALLLYHARQADSNEALHVVTRTLDHMARGGIWDHLGGGFHRYSTDRFWHVPHFEKMLYDNALLARVYLRAFEATGEPRYRQVVEDIRTFVAREMTSPEGGFYSALDAESEHEEGKYYVWKKQEIQDLLGQDDYKPFATVYGLDHRPNFEDDRYVLQQFEPIEQSAATLELSPADLVDRLGPMRDALLKSRDKRPRPLLDTKILTDWNGLMIAAMADAYRVLGEDAYRQAAEAAATFVLDKMRDTNGRLLHSYAGDHAKIPGYLADYAFFIDGLLALDQATEEERWLLEARALTDQMVQLFGDPASGGFYTTSADHDTLLARPKTAEDSVVPSGNSVAVQILVSLAERTGERRYAELAAQTLATFSSRIAAAPSEHPAMIQGLGQLLDAGFSVEQFAGAASPSNQAVLKAEAKLSVDQVQPGNEFHIDIELAIADGWHVNANPASLEQLIPVTVTLDSPLELKDVRTEYPKGESLTVEGLNESINVYAGRVSIRSSATPGEDATPGDSTIDVTIRYQACDANRCMPPQAIKLQVPMKVAGNGEAAD